MFSGSPGFSAELSSQDKGSVLPQTSAADAVPTGYEETAEA